MLGKKSDVATRIKEIEPKAYATHCHCHSLRLRVKGTTKGSKILTDAMEITKEIFQLIKLSPKSEQMLGVIKDSLERETYENEEVELGLAKFSATRWTVRAVCFKCIFKNYQALRETYKECLKQGGLSADIKARVAGCQAQMNSFNYWFGILLGERLFAHTDNLSAAQQKKDLSAVAGQDLANQTMETLKRIRDENSYYLFYDTVLEKKNHFQRFLNLHLKGKSKHPHDIFSERHQPSIH